MTAKTQGGESTRRVRPIFAALLTLFFGWGMGFFYAGRTKAAIAWTIASVVFSIGAAALCFAFPNTLYAPLVIAYGGNRPMGILVGLAVGAPVAIIAWIATARHPRAQKRGPLRLVGYLLIWFLPLTLASLLRFTTIQPFRIPSGAMQPTIHVGDYVLVRKWSYGYSRYSIAPFDSLAPAGRILARSPQRGDIVVFRSEREPDVDFVKRVIGVPGDRIQMRDGDILLNGQRVPRQAAGNFSVRDVTGAQSIPAFRETLPSGLSYVTLDRGVTELDTMSEIVVPPGHYFVMGDDRDNSADSRVAGFGLVPLDNFVGKVGSIIGGPNSR